MTHEPQITACVPVYNAAAFVTETLESIRAQTYPNLHVSISVDASSDESADLCRRFEFDRSSQVFVQDVRLNYLGNVNFLLERVQTKYLCIIPHDDTIAPEYLETLVAELQAHPSAIVAYTDIDRIGVGQTPMAQAAVVGPRVRRMVEFLHNHNSAVSFRGLVRLDLLPQRPALPPHRYDGFASDTAWLLELACHGELHRVPTVLYRKRIRDDSVVRGWIANDRAWHREAWLEHCRACATICLRQPLDDTERTVVIDALVCRAAMVHKNLWPHSGIHDMGHAEKQALIEQFLAEITS